MNLSCQLELTLQRANIEPNLAAGVTCADSASMQNHPSAWLLIGFAGLLMLCAQNTQAGSATWLASPATNHWLNASNWTSGGPPNGPSDVATFSTSNTTSLLHTADVQVSGIIFNSGASAFTITSAATLTISGAGITNNSGIIQNFIIPASSTTGINLTNSATAGSQTAFTIDSNNSGTVSHIGTPDLSFFNMSTAGSATITNNPATAGNLQDGGGTQFLDSATAANATITNNGSATTGTGAGVTNFFNSSTAGSAHITNKGATASGYAYGGQTWFLDSSTAGNSTITNEPGNIDGTGGTTDIYSSAGNATFTNNGGTSGALYGGETTIDAGDSGNATFINNGGTVNGASGGSTGVYNSMGNPTFIANGGTNGGDGGRIVFQEGDSGGTARVEVFGNGYMLNENAISGANIGSLEGDGIVYLGGYPINVTIGSNNLSTTFSGVIHNGWPVYPEYPSFFASITKVGTGTLSLTNANTYSGGTTVSAGTLLAGHDGALGNGNVSVAAGATLKLQNGTTNNYVFDGATLTVVTNSTVNLNFTGNPDIVGFLIVNGVSEPPGLYGSSTSGAPNQLPEFTGSGKILVTAPVAKSVKLHGSQSFGIPLPFTGPEGIECRSAGANNSYQMVVTFGETVTFTGASVTSGTGMVTSTSGNGTSTVTINLAGVTNEQRLEVTLSAVNYGAATGELPIRMAMLLGDVNGSGRVDAADVSAVRQQTLQPITSANFSEDVNASGRIDAADVSIARQQTLTSLP
jgi:autotransporter-associated beta strand protein